MAREGRGAGPVDPGADHRGHRPAVFIGTPGTVAETINRFVQADASDGFILVPHITPGGLDDFAAQVVPLLQERGVFRTDYQGSTLRDHLGLAPLAGGSSAARAAS